MSNSQISKFYTKVVREMSYINNNDNTEYELRFGQKSAGRFTPIFNETIKQKVFMALNITPDNLITEESINSYYDDNIRKVSMKAGESTQDIIECKEVVKRIDWYMDSGLCLRFAVSNENPVTRDISALTPLVIRSKVRQIYRINTTDTEIHFTTVKTCNDKGSKITQEMEIEYKKIKDMDIHVIQKILKCFD